MSHKKVSFNEQKSERQYIDSDDDAKEADGNIHDEEDAEAQEDATIEHDDGIIITPFNMKDEMEEGHFDRAGMFVFDKDKGLIRDNWIDNVDWVKVSDSKFANTQVNDTTDEMTKDDYISTYSGILELIKPGETILKGLRRLGGANSQSASQRWSKKKKQATTSSESNPKQNNEDLLRLTELADKLIQEGNMDTYEDTYEKVSFSLKQLQEQKVNVSGDKADNDEVELDMFAETLDGDRGIKRKHENDEILPVNKEQKVEGTPSTENEVRWIYKWSNEDDAETHGPISSSEMLKLYETDFFVKGAFCRKENVEGQFYDVKRIDFELYT